MSATTPELIRKALDASLAALRRLEWCAQAGTKCPACGRPKNYGHSCSCPTHLAFKAAKSAGVEVPLSRGEAPGPLELVRPTGAVALHEITLEQWARWRWVDCTVGGDRHRQFLVTTAREPDEVSDAIDTYRKLRTEHPGLFAHDSAHP